MNDKKLFTVILAIIVLFLIITGGAVILDQTSHPYGDTYHAVDPPVESGETVIEELIFDGDKVTMISGDVSQTVDYEIKDGQLTIKTDFGDFSYNIEETDEGLIIDGILYELDE